MQLVIIILPGAFCCQLLIQVKLYHGGSCRNGRSSVIHPASAHEVWPMRWCCRTTQTMHSWRVIVNQGKRCSSHSYWSESSTPAETVTKWKHGIYSIMLRDKQTGRQQTATGSVIAENERQPKKMSVYRSSGWRRFKFFIKLWRLTELWSLINENIDGQWPGLKVRFKIQWTKS